MIFAGISGTAVAETASIGAVMIPAMRKSGYDTPFAGAVPGLLLGLGMMLTVYILARIRSYPKGQWVGLRELVRSSRGAVWAILMTAIILFGIVGGVFTPTEASVVSALYAFVIGLFVYKGFRLKDLPGIVLKSAIGSGGLILLVGLANVFGWILTSEQIPQAIAAAMLALTTNKYLIILLINVLLLIVGTFMETIAALIILFPPLLPVATQVGIDPIYFAIFAILNLMIGLSTAPVGVCLFVAANIGKVTLGEVSRANLPFLFCNILILLLVSYIPALSLWLPNLFYPTGP